MDLGAVETELLSGFLGTLLLAIVSAWSLYNRDHESKRLFEMDKHWHRMKEPESASTRLATLRRRMVIGFSIFLCLNIAMCLFFGLEIARSLKWF